MHGEQSVQKLRPQIMLRHVAVPNEHGSWVFLFSPLLIGLFAGGTFRTGSILLVGAALAAFMLRQPITILVKIISKRRPRTELPAAAFWITIYGLIGSGFLAGLMAMGFEQRVWKSVPNRLECWLAGRKHISAATAAVILVSVLAVTRTVPVWLPLAYAIQLAETLWGTFNPAVKVKPTQIGVRQLIVSTLFTVAFIFAWS